MSSKWSELALLAAAQGGLFTTKQARDAGFSNSHLLKLQASGRIERVYRGVYEVCGNAWDRWQDVRAVWLSVSGGGSRPAVVSHRTAAYLWQIGVLASPNYEFTIPRRRQVADPAVCFHVGTLDSPQTDVYCGLPVTSPVRTVKDIAGVGVDGDHLGFLVRDALLQYDYPLVDYVEALAPFAGRYGCRDGGKLIEYVLGLVPVPERICSLRRLVAA